MYLYMIDNVFNQSKVDQEGFLKRLKAEIFNDPERFDNEFRNLKSFIVDQEEKLERIKNMKNYAQDQVPQQQKWAAEYRKILMDIIEKFNIKVEMN